VRTWLVVLGILITAIGAGLILTLFFLSTGPSTTVQIRPEDPGLPAHSTQPWVLPGPASGAGSVSLSWSSTALTSVSLQPATTCTGLPGYCATGPAVLSWSDVTSGRGTVSSANASFYLLLVTNPGTTPLSFRGIVSVQYSTGTPVSPVSWGLIASGGIALLAIGGIALFLGLFLAGGVYRPPPGGPVVVRHPSLPPDEPELDPPDDHR